MRRRWLRAALGVAALAAAVLLARGVYLWRAPKLGTLVATPPEPRLSMRVGETMRFTAAAEGATGFTWLLWGRPVAFLPSWSYTPGPEEAGWQQVTVEVSGRRGRRTSRTWELGVVRPSVPEIDTLEPVAGTLHVPVGERPRFRASAHLPAARPTDHLTFEWVMDERPVLRDERPAEEAASEVVLPPVEAGSHRLRLRVTEDGRTASLAEWTLEAGRAAEIAAAAPAPPATVPLPVGPPEPPVEIAKLPEPEPPVEVAKPTVPPPPPPPQLARALGARRLDARIGEALMLEARVEPPDAQVTRRWTLDGEPLAETGARLDYAPDKVGRHRIAVAVVSGDRTVGRDEWVVNVRPAPPPVVAAVPPPTAPPPAARVVRVPARRELALDVGRPLVLEARVEPRPPGVGYRWSLDGKPLERAEGARLEYRADKPGRHTISVTIEGAEGQVGRESWVVAVAAPPPRPAPDAVAKAPTPRPGPVAVPPSPPAASGPASSSTLAEADVRRWLAEYAGAWSRKDVAALRRMGQVRSAAEAAQLERYFRSVAALEVDVRLVRLTVEGERASVEFERTDTVTDPGGRRQQLRLPPIRKQIERTPEGLRFAGAG